MKKNNRKNVWRDLNSYGHCIYIDPVCVYGAEGIKLYVVVTVMTMKFSILTDKPVWPTIFEGNFRFSLRKYLCPRKLVKQNSQLTFYFCTLFACQFVRIVAFYVYFLYLELFILTINISGNNRIITRQWEFIWESSSSTSFRYNTVVITINFSRRIIRKYCPNSNCK